jgi:NTP pyrophosphatase (non-canonical NTP hydrolase)
MHELDWKPWKRKDALDLDKVAEEFADVLAFLGLFVVLLQHVGLDPDMLAMAYVAKSEKNKQRLLGLAAEYKARELSRRAEEILATLE